VKGQSSSPKDRAEAARDGSPPTDIDQFITGGAALAPSQISLDQVSRGDADDLAQVGVLVDGRARSGTYILRDSHALCARADVDGLELVPIAEALNRYDWLRENYWWKAVPADQDKITQWCAKESDPKGFFVRVRENAKVTLPLQAALYMAGYDNTQTVHNVVILEEDAELHLSTGCVSGHEAARGIHLAITEQYVGRNGRLTNTMVHHWGPKFTVRPHVGTIVQEGGVLVSNFISLRPARSLRSNPRTWLNGRNASARYMTIILGSEGSDIVTGGEVYLNAEGTSAELVHRGVCTGGKLYQRGLMVGNARCRAHIDCAGMLVDPKDGGLILSNPGLKALHREAQLSHEASIGKIAPEQVTYLQARGMSEREAISMIIRGFLATDIEGLGPQLDAAIAEIAAFAGHGEGD